MKKQIAKKSYVDAIRRREQPVVTIPVQKNAKTKVIANLTYIVAVVFVLTSSVTIASASSTVSYFRDAEISMGNLLHAGTLDFTVALSDPASKDVKLTAGQASVTVIPTVAPGAGDFPLAYKVHIEKIGGTNPALCDAINVTASPSPFDYTGSLLAFSVATTTSVTPLSLSLSLPANSSFSTADNCSVDIVYSGWVDGQNEGLEYHDVERVSLTISDPPAISDTPELESTSTPEQSSISSDIIGQGSTTPADIATTSSVTADASSTPDQISTSTSPQVDIQNTSSSTPSENVAQDIPVPQATTDDNVGEQTPSSAPDPAPDTAVSPASTPDPAPASAPPSDQTPTGDGSSL